MHKISLVFFLAVSYCAPSFASAAIMSYSNDFAGSVAEFSETTDGQWTLGAGVYQNEILSTASNKTSSSLLSFGTLGGPALLANDFSLSTTFIVTNSVADFNTLGFAFLGNSADATTNASSHYLADVYVGGGMMNAQLRFAEIGLTPTLIPTMLDLGKVLLQNIPYLLQLDGTYANNGDLHLTLGLTGDNDFDVFQTSINAANVLTGNHFGYRDRASGGANSTLTVEYDSLGVTAIPEPLSIGYLAASLIGGYVIGMYIRHRMASLAA